MAIAISFLGSSGDGGSSSTQLQVLSINTTGAEALIIIAKHEGAATTITCSTSTDTTGWVSLALESHTNNDLHTQAWYKLNPTGNAADNGIMDVAAAKAWKGMAVWKVTTSPTADVELIDNVTGEGTGTSISDGVLDATAAYVAAMMVPDYGGAPFTAASGWTERADTNSIYAADAASGSSGSLTVAATATSSAAWVAAGVLFQEVGAGPSFKSAWAVNANGIII